MGDLRFDRPYRRVKQAADRAAAIKALADEEVIAALAAARAEDDPYLANVLASEALNRLHRSSTIVTTATEGLLSQTVDGLLTHMNPAAERLLGWTFEELRGKPIHDIVHGRRADGTPYPMEECPIHGVAASGIPIRRHQTWLWHKDGRMFPVEQDAAPIIREGEIEGVVVALRDVSGERAAREQQRASEARYRSLFEEAPAMYMIVDAEGRIQATNRFGEEYLGYDREELVGRRMWELFHPDDRERMRGEHFRLFADPPPPGRPREWEARKMRKDGTVVHVREFSVPTQDERGRPVALQSCHDLSQHHRLRRELEDAEHRTRNVIENVADIVYTIDTEGRYFTLNAAFTRILGWPREEWIGKSFEPLVHPEDLAPTRAALERAMEGGTPSRFEVRVRTSSGAYVTLEAVAVPRIEDDRVTGLYGVARDVSARREMEGRLRLRAEERTAELREALQDLETFTNSVSHDLRAPLRGLAALLGDILADHGQSLTPEVRALVEQAQREDHRASRLVNDILAFSRGGRDPVRPAPVDISAAARQVAQEVSASHPEWRTAWEIEEGMRAVADPKLLRILLHNLLHNAAKYASSSAQPRVRMLAEERDGARWFAVKDNGVGFAPEESYRLFQPFARLSSSAGFEGTGLGLPTAKRIVERHGGRIEAEGSLRQGATFRFTFESEAGEEEARGETRPERLLRG